MAATLGEQAQHRRRSLLDRAPRHIDARPIVPRAQLARERHLLGHRFAIDVLGIIVMRLEAKEPVLANLVGDDGRARVQHNTRQCHQPR